MLPDPFDPLADVDERTRLEAEGASGQTPARKTALPTAHIRRFMVDYVAGVGRALGFTLGSALQAQLSSLGEDPDDLVPLPLFERLLEEASVELGDPCYGLRVGLGTPLVDLRAIGHVMLHSPTIGAAIEHAQRYIRVTQTDTAFRTRVEGDLLCLSYHVFDPSCTHCYQDADFTSGVLIASLAALGENEIHAAEVRLRRPETDRRAPYRELLPGVRLRFGQPESAVLIDKGVLERPVKNADPYLGSILEQHVEALLEKSGSDGLESRVERAIAEGLRAGQPRIDEIARALGIGERTLQRRLSERGLTFRDVTERVLERLARDHIARPELSFSEVAFLLGYSEARAFSRAFRRWTGQSPREFRRRALAAAAG